MVSEVLLQALGQELLPPGLGSCLSGSLGINRAQRRLCLCGWAQPNLDKLKALARIVPLTKLPTSELTRGPSSLPLVLSSWNPSRSHPGPVHRAGLRGWNPLTALPFLLGGLCPGSPRSTADLGEVWEKSPCLLGGPGRGMSRHR